MVTSTKDVAIVGAAVIGLYMFAKMGKDVYNTASELNDNVAAGLSPVINVNTPIQTPTIVKDIVDTIKTPSTLRDVVPIVSPSYFMSVVADTTEDKTTDLINKVKDTFGFAKDSLNQPNEATKAPVRYPDNGVKTLITKSIGPVGSETLITSPMRNDGLTASSPGTEKLITERTATYNPPRDYTKKSTSSGFRSSTRDYSAGKSYTRKSGKWTISYPGR